MNHEHDIDEQDFGPSRSQRRRDALALLNLGEQLVALPSGRLEQLDLPEDVREEIANVRRIKAHIARKRQLAYLAKLMRRHGDEAFATVRAALDEDREHQHQEAAALHRLEALRERLLDDGDEALTALIEAHPDADRQRLRALIRQTRSERDRNKPPRAYRELFRMLREIVGDGSDN